MNKQDSNDIKQSNTRIAELNHQIKLLTDIRNNREGNPLWIALKELFIMLRDESLHETAEGLVGKDVSVEIQIIKARKAASAALGFQLAINTIEKADDKISEFSGYIENRTRLINAIKLKYEKIEEKKQNRYGGKDA